MPDLTMEQALGTEAPSTSNPNQKQTPLLMRPSHSSRASAYHQGVTKDLFTNTEYQTNTLSIFCQALYGQGAVVMTTTENPKTLKNDLQQILTLPAVPEKLTVHFYRNEIPETVLRASNMEATLRLLKVRAGRDFIMVE